MESNTIPINHFQSETFEVENKFSKINVGDVFKEKHHSYLNEFTLFLAHFNAIPNFMHEINIDCKNAIKWFSKAYKEEINRLPI